MSNQAAALLKNQFRRTLPGAYGAVQAGWRALLAMPLPDRAWRMERRLARISAKLRARHGSAVLSGPFAGMRYVSGSVGSVLSPKLIGCYEAELAPILEGIRVRGYPVVIDVGCAEGYYAVGLAIGLPSARVFAFDLDERARLLCAEMAALNEVAERVVVEGACDVARLRRLPLAGALLICDCEGFEIELLQPDLAPGLKRCDLLVELHDGRDPRITPTLRERFAPTHDIALIASTARDPDAYPAVHFLPAASRRLAVCEFRSPQQWAWMRARPGLEI